MVVEGERSPENIVSYMRNINMTMNNTMDNNTQIDQERISSAADAMLKLSSSFQHDTNTDYHSLSDQYTQSGSPSEDGMRPRSSSMSQRDRAERAFVPDGKKDDHYWTKRRKNNEAAKRSREKRRMLDMAMTDKVAYVSKINNDLQDELVAIKEHFNLPVDLPFCANNFNELNNTNNSFHQEPMDMNVHMSPLNSIKPVMPHVPKIPLAAMASFLHQQQQLVTQAAASVFNNTSRDVTPLIVTPQSKIDSTNYVPISSILPTTMTTVPQQVIEPPYATSSKPPPAIHDHRIDSYYNREQHFHNIAMQQDGIPNNKRQRMSSDDSDEGALQIDDVYNDRHTHSRNGNNGNAAVTISESKPSSAVLTTSSSSNVSINDDGSSDIDYSVQSAHSYQKGIPLKLRHKHINFGCHSAAVPQLNNHQQQQQQQHQAPVPKSVANNFASAAIKIDPYENNQIPKQESIHGDIDSDSNDSSYMDDSDSHTPPNMLGLSYTERRRKNNVAARKCRENKKLLMKMKEAQSNYLESENMKLRDELKILCDEVQGLKELMNDKHVKEQHGEKYTPPPLEVLEKILLDKSGNKH